MSLDPSTYTDIMYHFAQLAIDGCWPLYGYICWEKYYFWFLISNQQEVNNQSGKPLIM